MLYMTALARETELAMREADAQAPQRAIVTMTVNASRWWRNLIFRSVLG
jgi:hypothetical protein